MLAQSFPIRRTQPDVNTDILSGDDFLSLLMGTSSRRRYAYQTSPPTSATVIEINDNVVNSNRKLQNVRASRSTPPFAQTTTEEQLPVSDKISDSRDSSTDGVILAIRISSSVGKTINKEYHEPSNNIFEASTMTSVEVSTQPPTTEIEFASRQFVPEDLPSIVAEARKSEFNVEESEPITKDNASSLEYEESYPAKVEPLPSQTHTAYDPTADFLSQGFGKSTKQPIHHTVIYHDNSEDTKSARSVSYSSIIQALPQLPVDTEKPIAHERHERNYNGAQVAYINTFSGDNEKSKNESSLNNPYLPRSPPVTEPWHTSVKQKEMQLTTERNWETHERSYALPTGKAVHIPKVYGRSEQNYEVDEAASVETNGRTHGVQPTVLPRTEKKHDDNQKVGYVVEGRNYRKYRVEERTADGFIVGEYGVVSHDDGSLRGVRYTADGTINPRLISEALMKFLSL